MDVTKSLVKVDYAHCNFCNRGILNTTGFGLIYPYEFVYEFIKSRGNGLKAAICEDCLMELNTKVKILNDI